MGKEAAILHCACNVPVIASACLEHQDEGRLPLMERYVGECPVTALRDSRCNEVMVRSSLVDDDQLTGKTRVLMLMNQSLSEAPTARCHVRTPVFTLSCENPCIHVVM